MMLVEVPTSVTKPPSRDMKDIGIRSDDGEVLVERLTLRATGIMMARAPTFFVSMDKSAVAPDRTGTWVCSDFSRGRMGRTSSSRTPDRATRRALMIRAEAMITTTSLVKPVKALSVGTSPVIADNRALRSVSSRNNPQASTLCR